MIKYLNPAKETLADEEVICWDCECEILIYYSPSYSGRRGRCPKCEIDFPLE